MEIGLALSRAVEGVFFGFTFPFWGCWYLLGTQRMLASFKREN